MAAYEEALQRLCQVPVANYLAERKRLAAELRARGDEAGATQIAKRPKPSASVWVVNHLYWTARDVFDEMLAAASPLRRGELRASKAYHDTIATLRRRAAIALKDAGVSASDVTLRRVATTLAAIAAAGGFEPDPPGALAADRDPPGFAAVSVVAKPAEGAPHAAPAPDRTAARVRAAEAMERKRREAERARRKAERSRVQQELRTATAEVRQRERAFARLEQQVRDADQALSAARAMMQDLERRLAELDEAE
jgi:hypothetical protein